jgi:hypothetical protein
LIISRSIIDTNTAGKKNKNVCQQNLRKHGEKRAESKHRTS